MSTATAQIDQLCINTIRTLSIDGVEAANSGHPGAPMGMAPVAYTLWTDRLRYDPAAPLWPARDRFVLSAGHASMLLYSLLHLAGVRKLDESGQPLDEPAVALDDLRNFRQLGSPCPGHPEHGDTTGVETTTGPLGQGVSNAVGMAIAQRWLAARMNRPGFELFDYNVYALCGDGELMEGVSSEAASLAGHLRLANLCWIYDSNRITIDGSTDLSFSESVAGRFAAYGWNVVDVDDANDLDALKQAYATFEATDDRPTMIIVRSQIAFGAPHKQGTSGAHGAPLGAEEVRLTKEAYGWPADKQFYVPDEAAEHFRQALAERGGREREAWEASFAEYAKKYPELAEQWRQMASGELPDGWDADIPTFPADAKGVASRSSSGKVLNAVAQRMPWLVGGAADLAASTKTTLTFDGTGDFQADSYGGRNLHFGIREHGMAAALNGMALSRLRPFGSTFLVFSDYLRPSLRLSAIMHLPVIYVFTHDSLGVGEDGPTHQPVEHLAALRAIPGLLTFRPADANEVAETWRTLIPIGDRPAALALSRQDLPTLDRTKYAAASGVAKGAYVLADSEATPDVILMATGSEVSLCIEAYEQLTAEGVQARVVSMPCWELFEEQDAAYRDSVLPAGVTARVAVELGVRQGWDRYLGPGGTMIGVTGFGASGPAEELLAARGFTVDNVLAAAKRQLG
ncbi:MAG: transketolase [Planctomycetales bacterium]|nr:transketolase [Planctomycetales bacterium]